MASIPTVNKIADYPRNLTARQIEVLQAIATVTEREAWPPSIEEVRRELKPTCSTQGVIFKLGSLQGRGYVTREKGTLRSLRLTDLGREALRLYDAGMLPLRAALPATRG